MYWTVGLNGTSNGAVRRANLDGTGNTTLLTGGVAQGVRQLTFIPEPGTYALIFGCAALGVAGVLRHLGRRKLRASA